MKTLLQDCCPRSSLSGRILPRESFRPYPVIDERAPWEAVAEEMKQLVLERAEGFSGYAWPALKLTDYLAYTTTGQRTPYEFPFFDRRRALLALVLGECTENKGRFMDDIVNGIWAICEETSWVIPAHNHRGEKGRGAIPYQETAFVDLFSAETGALLSWTHYLLRERLLAVHPDLCARLAKEVGDRIITPYLEHDDFWWQNLHEGSSINNWNPWCTSNVLSALFLLEDSPERRAEGTWKAMRGLDRFIASYPDDGGCDEGPDYWGHAGGSLYDCLRLLHGATDGAVDIYNAPIIKNIAAYIAKMHISKNRFANFADSKALLPMDEEVLYSFGRKTGQKALSAMGAYSYQNRDKFPLSIQRSVSLMRMVPFLTASRELGAASTDGIFPEHSFMPGLQVLSARESGGTDQGFFMAAKGGHNAESHNHNDIGQFMVFQNGLPMVIDVGVERYTAKTFSAQRYEIWTMRSEYHNLPTVNGFVQEDGKEYRAAGVTGAREEGRSVLAVDMTPAYPKEAKLASWKRRCALVRGENACVEVTDAYTLREAGGEVVHNLMLAKEPVRLEDGVYAVGEKDSGVLLRFSNAELAVSVERIDIEDELLASFWEGTVYRLRAKETLAGQSGELTLWVEKL